MVWAMIRPVLVCPNARARRGALQKPQDRLHFLYVEKLLAQEIASKLHVHGMVAPFFGRSHQTRAPSVRQVRSEKHQIAGSILCNPIPTNR